MRIHNITDKQICGYKLKLEREEKSPATIEKYIRDIGKFSEFLNGGRISREQVLAYKQYLIERYKARSVNSMLAALNSFLVWQGLDLDVISLSYPSFLEITKTVSTKGGRWDL